MKLENNFTIDAPVEKAWEALNSPETVAPCFPGATLTEYEGDAFSGTVKVKLGPIAMTYKGKGTYVTRDEDAHRVVIDAKGRDSRGNGTANALVLASRAAYGPYRTAVSMVTDMTITGKPAQFGRGVISDVADKIIEQFSACVARKLAADPAAPTPAAAASNGAGSAGTARSGRSAAATTTTADEAEAERTVEAVNEGAAALRTAPAADAPSARAAVADVEGSTAVVEATDEGAAALGTAATGTPRASGGSPATTAPPSAAPAAAGTAATPPSARTGPRAPVRSEVDAIDLLDTAGAPVLKRVAPAVGGVVLLLLVILLVRKLRSG